MESIKHAGFYSDLDDNLQKNICNILKSLSDEKIKEVIKTLKDIGVETLLDLKFVHEEDLSGKLKPVQIRKLLFVWTQQFGSCGQEIIQNSPPVRGTYQNSCTRYPSVMSHSRREVDPRKNETVSSCGQEVIQNPSPVPDTSQNFYDVKESIPVMPHSQRVEDPYIMRRNEPGPALLKKQIKITPKYYTRISKKTRELLLHVYLYHKQKFFGLRKEEKTFLEKIVRTTKENNLFKCNGTSNCTVIDRLKYIYDNNKNYPFFKKKLIFVLVNELFGPKNNLANSGKGRENGAMVSNNSWENTVTEAVEMSRLEENETDDLNYYECDYSRSQRYFSYS